MVAAAFEEAGPELIDDNGYAPVPPDMITASFEAGCGYKEEKLEEGDDKEAPRPPDKVASSFEGHGYEEEEKPEEGEDDEAPHLPSMIASSCEENDAADHKATKATTRQPVMIDEGVDSQVPEERNDGTHMKQRKRQEIINRVMREIDEAFDNDGTPANTNTGNRGSRSDPSSSSNQPPFTASNVQVGAPSITPTPQRRDQRSLSLAANDQQGHVGMTIPPTEESMPSPRLNFDRSQQSLPLLEATFVQDVPEEPVYDATLVQRISKFRVVVLGSVLVAMAAVVAVVVIVFGSLKEPPTPPITTSTSSTSAPGTETNTVSE